MKLRKSTIWVLSIYVGIILPTNARARVINHESLSKSEYQQLANQERQIKTASFEKLKEIQAPKILRGLMASALNQTSLPTVSSVQFESHFTCPKIKNANGFERGSLDDNGWNEIIRPLNGGPPPAFPASVCLSNLESHLLIKLSSDIRPETKTEWFEITFDRKGTPILTPQNDPGILVYHE